MRTDVHTPMARLASQAAVVLILACMAAPASAAPLSCWDIPTLDGLIAQGARGCRMGPREFFDFSYSIDGWGGAVEVAPADIQVRVGNVRFGSAIAFDGLWSVASGQSLEGTLSYRFRSVRVRRVDVALDTEALQHTGTASMEGAVCLGDTLPCDSGASFPLMLSDPAWFGHAEFRPGYDAGRITISFALRSGDGDTVLVRSVATDVEIPEPTVPLLTAIGAIGAAVHRARRRSRSSEHHLHSPR